MARNKFKEALRSGIAEGLKNLRRDLPIQILRALMVFAGVGLNQLTRYLLGNWYGFPTVWLYITGSFVSHTFSFSVVLSLFLILVGWLASTWKNRHQLSYGYSEVFFGTLVSLNLFLNLMSDHSTAKLLGIAAAVYIISRGFNNVREAKAVRPVVLAASSEGTS